MTLKKIQKITIVTAILATITIPVGNIISSQNKENKENDIVEVIEVTPTMYAKLYNNKTEYKEFNTEIECAESFSEDWYSIHENDESEKNLIDVIQNNEKEIELVYQDKKEISKVKIQYDNELECAETYSNTWYYINE